MLAAGIALAVNGWGLVGPEGTVRFFGKTNATTLLVWGLWWPCMIWCAVLLGRVWCVVCPLELLNNLAERTARRLGFGQLQLPRWIVSGALIIALYGALQLVVAGEVIIRVPAYTSIFLLLLAAIAVITGLLYRDRALCRGFCPIGELLGTYGRGGMLAVRAAQEETCRTCTERNCVSNANRYKLDCRSCPSLLNPPKLEAGRDCLVCMQCFKSCSKENVQVILRWPFDKSDTRPPITRWPTTLFVMLVSGFVSWELSTEWGAAEAMFLAVPQRLAHLASLARWQGYFNGIWALVVVPLFLWSALGWILVLRKGAPNLTTAWRLLALPMAVVVSAGHMARGLAKFTSWASFLPYAAHDPSGIGAAVAMANKEIARPAGILPVPLVSAFGAIVVLSGLWFALREAKLVYPGRFAPYRIPLLGMTAFLLFFILGWGLAGK